MSESLSTRTIRNSLYNLLNFVWPVVLSVVATPILIHKLGVERYGMYVLSLTIIPFLSTLVMGTDYAFVRSLAEFHAKGERAGIKKLIGSFLTVFTILGIVGLVIVVLFSNSLTGLFHISKEDNDLFKASLWVTGLIFLSTMVGGVFTAVPTALQRFDIVTKWSVASSTFMNGLMIGAAMAGFSFLALVLIYFLTTVATSVYYFFRAQTLLPGVRIQYLFDRDMFRPAVKFGFFVFVNNLASTIVAQVDRFFVSALLGPASLTFYTVPGNVTQKIQGFISSISSILFPLSSDLHARNDRVRLQMLYRRAVRMIVMLSSAAGAVFFVFGDKILRYWVGAEIARRGIIVLYYLVPTYFLLSLFVPVTNFLLGLGRSQLLAYSSALMAAINVLLLPVLIPRYGINGAALAYLLSVVPVIFLLVYLERRELHLTDILDSYSALVLKLGVVGGIWYVGTRYGIFPFVTNIFALIIALPLAFLLFLLLYKALGFLDREDWDAIMIAMRRSVPTSYKEH